MKRFSVFAALAALALLSVSCAKSRMEQMQMAKDVVITTNPEVLEIVGGKVPVAVTVTCPKGYFHPKATMDVEPVLVYEGGELRQDRVLQYQGDKVKDNYKVVSSKGATITERLTFKYVPGIEKSHLELRGVVHYKDKDYPMPAVKVAEGCIATYQLASTGGVYKVKPDGYQAVIERSTEGRILYDVNSDKVRKGELESYQMEYYLYALDGLQSDERSTVTGTEIVAYASPEGGKDYNAALSDKRADSARDAWDKLAKDLELSGISVKSIGQDWEGFKEAVAKSNIPDKDLILRVLSMYSDPAVRESEIRNLSQIYAEINKSVFPELRRARFITTSEYRNWSDEELIDMAQNQGLDKFDEPSLLRLATITESPEAKEPLYKLAISKYNSDTARYNLATLYLDEGKTSLAGAYLGKIKEPDSDVLNAQGVVAMRNGEYGDAAEFFRKAESETARQNVVVMDILKGDYAAAKKDADGLKGHNAAVANILAGDLDAASAAITCKCAKSNYLRAIIAARKGDTASARELLDAVKSSSPALAERAEKDMEFAAIAAAN